MRRDSVVAGQLIGPSWLSLRGDRDPAFTARLELAPTDDRVTLGLESEGTARLDRPLPLKLRATIDCGAVKALLVALRQMVVAPREKRKKKGSRLQVSWCLQLSGGQWEVSYGDEEEIPPLEQLVAAVTALSATAVRAADAVVEQDTSLPRQRSGRWLIAALLVALLVVGAAVALVIM